MTTVDEIYSEMERSGENLRSVLQQISADDAAAERRSSKWSIAKIAEHVALVESRMSQLCGSLLAKAESDGVESDGSISISESFAAKGVEARSAKLEAPEFVHPHGAASIDESLARLDSSRAAFEKLRPLFNKYDCSKHKFPHPYFGDLTAVEWLIVTSGHKTRHLEQIERLLKES